MSNDNKLIESTENVKNHFEHDQNMEKLRNEVLKKFENYKNILNLLAADAPIQTLCLPTAIENVLLAHGLLRIYDLFNCDFTKIKGLGSRRIGDLTARLDQFLSML